jgi:hypothetical protein
MNERAINDCFTDDTEPDYFGYTEPAYNEEGADPTKYENKGHNQYAYSWIDSTKELNPGTGYVTQTMEYEEDERLNGIVIVF